MPFAMYMAGKGLQEVLKGLLVSLTKVSMFMCESKLFVLPNLVRNSMILNYAHLDVR